jgi:hypothetical protein
MKLIRCKTCEDVVRLIHTEWRKCYCGKSGGQYNDDLLSATVGGNCEVIGIRNDFFTESKKNRFKEHRNVLILGEYIGDTQIHRINSPKGPKLKMIFDKIDDETVQITFKDRRKVTVNLRSNKHPKTLKLPFNKIPSFKPKTVKRTKPKK